MTDIDLNNLNDDQLGDLSDLVHEQASQSASNAINAGEQLEFLYQNGWTEGKIIIALMIIDQSKEKEA